MIARHLLGVAVALALVVPSSAYPHEAEDIPTGDYRGASHRGVVPSQGTRLATSKLNLSSAGITLLALVSKAELDVGAPNDIWGYTSPSGREYGIMGTRFSTVFVEITNPQSPVVVAKLDGPTSVWRDMKTFGSYSYSVSEGGGGIQVFDLSAIDNGVVTHVGNVVGGATNTHNVVVDTDSGFLYRVGSGGGVLVYDLNPDPAVPQFVGSWTDTYVHDAQAVTYPGGQQVLFLCTPGKGLTILDATDKNDMIKITAVNYPNAGYSHQVWISEDRQYAYLADETDETWGWTPTSTTHVFDISDLAQTSFVGSYTNGNKATDHNLFVRDDLIFCSNYASGLRIFDRSSDPVNPTEIAFFDTYPANDKSGFNGMWGVYPFFPSGRVICSDRTRGMFVFQFGPPNLSLQFAGSPPAVLDPAGQTAIVTISEATAGNLVAGSEQLHFDDGTGLVSIPLTPLGGGQYEADFPTLACGATVQYFVSATSTDNSTWFDPPLAPSEAHSAMVASDLVNDTFDDLESDTGWTVGAPDDDATDGLWVRVDPNGTGAQPEDDHTPNGTQCWVTGQGAPGAPHGQDDIDDGQTTLFTPVYDLSGMSAPTISYWRWYSNDANGKVDDTFTIEIDNGSGWVTYKTIGPGHPEASGGWVQDRFLVSDIVPPTSTVQMRFRASDIGVVSVVEAAIDDFSIDNLVCDPTVYCTAKTSFAGCVPAIGGSGTPSVSLPAPFDVEAAQVPNSNNGLLFYGYAQSATPFSGGTLCVQPPLKRTAIQSSGGSGPPTNDCSGSFTFDFNALVQIGVDPLLTAGTSAYLQYWFRDPLDAFGFGLSDALCVQVQP